MKKILIALMMMGLSTGAMADHGPEHSSDADIIKAQQLENELHLLISEESWKEFYKKPTSSDYDLLKKFRSLEAEYIKKAKAILYSKKEAFLNPSRELLMLDGQIQYESCKNWYSPNNSHCEKEYVEYMEVRD